MGGTVLGLLTCASLLLPWVTAVSRVGSSVRTYTGLDLMDRPGLTYVSPSFFIALGLVSALLAATGRVWLASILHIVQLVADVLGLIRLQEISREMVYYTAFRAEVGYFLPAVFSFLWFVLVYATWVRVQTDLE